MVRPVGHAAPSQGSAGIVDGRWVEESVVRAALERASVTNRRHALELFNDYKVMTIRDTFADRLTYEQRCRYHFIDQPDRWDMVEDKFVSEVDKFR